VSLLAEGYARAKALTRRHSKSFYFSSVALFGERRRAAFALYAFCRRLDDLVDGDNEGDGVAQAPAASGAALAARLTKARAAVGVLYARPEGGEGAPTALGAQGPWHPAEFAAFRDTVERYRIPQQPFQALIDGMEMDLTQHRYPTFEALRLYCHRVAGVVGLMMTPVLGLRDERCLVHADELGVAMQLTNILRDVKEDLARGRVYLPADELAQFGIDEAQLQAGRVDERWVSFMKFQVARARELYARAALGVPDLVGFGSQRVVRLMGTVYGGILEAIEAQGYDVFTRRARVPFGRKLVLAAGVMLTPNPTQVALPAGELPRLGAQP
jgi:phytoene synthase